MDDILLCEDYTINALKPLRLYVDKNGVSMTILLRLTRDGKCYIRIAELYWNQLSEQNLHSFLTGNTIRTAQTLDFKGCYNYDIWVGVELDDIINLRNEIGCRLADYNLVPLEEVNFLYPEQPFCNSQAVWVCRGLTDGEQGILVLCRPSTSCTSCDF